VKDFDVSQQVDIKLLIACIRPFYKGKFSKFNGSNFVLGSCCNDLFSISPYGLHPCKYLINLEDCSWKLHCCNSPDCVYKGPDMNSSTVHFYFFLCKNNVQDGIVNKSNKIQLTFSKSNSGFQMHTVFHKMSIFNKGKLRKSNKSVIISQRLTCKKRWYYLKELLSLWSLNLIKPMPSA
jgi:hypothetical protein